MRKIASRQEGVITTRQLLEAGLSEPKIRRWVDEGHISRRHQNIYTVGHDALSLRGELIIALFYAGAGAALSHMTAAWWWGALANAPRRIHVKATHSRRSTREIKVHCPRSLERVLHKGLPVTPVPQTVLDCAAQLQFRALRKMIAEVEYQELASLIDLGSVLTQGHPGSRALRRALAAHEPQLARTRSPLEERFLYFCEEHGIRVPEFNREIGGFTVDAVWLDADPPLIVELDSRAAHATPARMEEDRRRDLILRAAGFDDIWRYTGLQLEHESRLVAAELTKRLG